MMVNQVNAGNPKIWVMDFDIYSEIGTNDIIEDPCFNYDYSNNKLESINVTGDYTCFGSISRDRTVSTSLVYGVRLHIRYREGTDTNEIRSYSFGVWRGDTFENILEDFDTRVTSAWFTDDSLSSTWEHQYITLGTAAKGQYIGCYLSARNEPNEITANSYVSIDYIRVDYIIAE